MEIWKKELLKLAKDFRVPLRICNYIISETEKITTSNYREEENFLYNTAHRKLKAYIFARL